MYNNGNSSKNVTGSSVVDGTLENADYADDGISGDKIDGGIISNFQSTGIDDNATSTAITIDASENVGIGNASPSYDLDISAASGDVEQRLYRAANVKSSTHYQNSVQHWEVGNSVNVNNTFGIKDVTASRAVLNITGSRVLIGCTANPSASVPGIGMSGSNNGQMSSADTTGPYNHMLYYNANGLIGNINTSGSTTSFVTSSDYRLKENVVPMAGSIDRLKALKPSRFNFIKDPLKTVDGFLAHEAGAVVPECSFGEKDGMMDEEYEVTPAVMDGDTVVTEAVMGTRSVPDYQGIDQAKLVPLLVASLQEAIARIETLENN